MTVHDLDAPCPVCHRPSGDHTLREWARCLNTKTLDLPFEPIPADAATTAAAALRKQLNIDDDVILADHVIVRALTLAGASGPLAVRLPCVHHDFQLATPQPVTVARILFVGNPDSIHGYGRLIRDSANGAVNAAKQGR
jgi:hypothetical protein